MKLTALVENIPHSGEFEAVHGLGVYIETESHKLLFDVGPDDTLLRNAETLGIDLTAVDTVVISHGHYDHGGGLESFFAINPHAAVYISEQAFGAYYAKDDTREAYVGLDPAMAKARFTFTGAGHTIDESLQLISHIQGSKLQSASSAIMMQRREDAFVPDTFAHEQSLIITEGDKRVLLGGCAHTGVINILEAAEEKAGPITHLISGFHLMAPTESEDLIRGIAGELKRHNTQYYTCHCTGERAYAILKEELGGQISYFSSGMQLEL